jgi:hypothetical protein
VSITTWPAHANVRRSALILTAALWSCSGRQDKTNDGRLAQAVHTYCGQLTYDLEHGATAYAENAPRLDNASDGEKQRLEQRLRWSSISVSEDVREQKLTAVEKQLNFCIYSRKIDVQQIGALQARGDDIIKRLEPALAGGQLPSRDETVKALRDLAALAREVEQLPLLD